MERALAALDWVQQNIRYVGVELGTGSLVPSPPAVVCERRFGDCKDQSYLLCALLRRLGMEADPVLVNTWARQMVAEMLPSPFAFNHVITRIRSDGRTYFVDPSNSFQRGPVAHRFMPDYGQGLAATGEKGSLLAFGSHQGLAPDIEVLTTFRAAEWDQPASLEVQSVRKGGAADHMRQITATTRLEELSRGFLNYYAARYTGLQPAGDLLLEDDPESNVLRLVERYSLPEFWLAREEPRGYHAEVFADAISEAIPVPQTKVRSTPLAVGHPLRVYQRIRIELPEPWTSKSRKAKYSNAAFDLAVSNVHDGRTVTLAYEYRTHAVCGACQGGPEVPALAAGNRPGTGIRALGGRRRRPRQSQCGETAAPGGGHRCPGRAGRRSLPRLPAGCPSGSPSAAAGRHASSPQGSATWPGRRAGPGRHRPGRPSARRDRCAEADRANAYRRLLERIRQPWQPAISPSLGDRDALRAGSQQRDGDRQHPAAGLLLPAPADLSAGLHLPADRPCGDRLGGFRPRKGGVRPQSLPAAPRRRSLEWR